MLGWQRGKKRIFVRVIALIVAQVFFFTNIAYAAPPERKRRSLFEGKRPNYKAIQERREAALEKRKDSLSGKRKVTKPPYKQDFTDRIKQSCLKDLSSIYIPESLGRVIEVYQSPLGNERLIVHIQDLHTNPEAQLNLASILEILIKDYDLGLVCSEGAEGEVDTSSVSSFPDSEVRERVARLFIDSGELTGEEYLSITKYPDLPIWGVEDKHIYFKNIIEFNKIMRFSGEAQDFIQGVKQGLGNLKPKIYSKKLLEVDKKFEEYDQNTIEPNEYIDYLLAFNIVRASPPQVDESRTSQQEPKYPNISLLKETLKFEKTINQDKIMRQSQDLLKNLQPILSNRNKKKEMDTLLTKASLFKDQKIAPFSFYSYLKDLALKHNVIASPSKARAKQSQYSHLSDFVEYLEKVNSLDSAALFQEIEELTYETKDFLSTNEAQKLLTKSLRHIKFLEDFFNLKVSNEELDYYTANREYFKVGFFKGLLKEGFSIDFNPGLIDDKLPELEYFYEIARKRDIAMVHNAVEKIEKGDVKVAAFISGGFHTRGITTLLKQKGYSYVVISPYSSTEIDEENYRNLLSGKRKPLSDLIDGLNEKLRPPMLFGRGINSFQAFSLKEGGNDLGEVIIAAIKDGYRDSSRIAVPNASVQDMQSEDVFEMAEDGVAELSHILGITDEEKLGALIHRAFATLERWNINTTYITDKKILIALLEKTSSKHLLEDCTQNNFIGINKTLLEIAELDTEVARILFVVGLFHGLRYEAGDEVDENDLTREAMLTYELMREEDIEINRVTEVLSRHFENTDFIDVVKEIFESNFADLLWDLGRISNKVVVTKSGKIFTSKRPEELLSEITDITEKLNRELKDTKESIKESMAASVKDYRALRGFSLTELAKLSGVGATSISQIENQKFGIPSEEMQARLAEGLEVSFKDLALQRPQERILKKAILDARRVFGLLVILTHEAYNMAIASKNDPDAYTNNGRSELTIAKIRKITSRISSQVKDFTLKLAIQSVNKQSFLRQRRIVDQAIGREFRKKREEKGLKIKELSEITGISREDISHLELGYYEGRPESVLVKLASAMDTTLNDIKQLIHPILAKEKMLQQGLEKKQNQARDFFLDLRRKKRISKKAMGKNIGHSEFFITRFEKRTTPITPRRLSLLAKALEVDIGDSWPADDLVEFHFADTLKDMAGRIRERWRELTSDEPNPITTESGKSYLADGIKDELGMVEREADLFKKVILENIDEKADSYIKQFPYFAVSGRIKELSRVIVLLRNNIEREDFNDEEWENINFVLTRIERIVQYSPKSLPPEEGYIDISPDDREDKIKSLQVKGGYRNKL